MDTQNKIIRIWKGWTTLENAPIYENMLINEVFPEVKKKGVTGLEKVSISFAGENYEIAYIPENAKRVLLRYDTTAQHYTLREELIL